MEPLQAFPMPAAGVLVGITAANSWQTGTALLPSYFAYIATDSTLPLSFVSLRNATRPGDVALLTSRQSYLDDMPYGVVIEVYLKQPLAEGEAVYVALAQAGATTYFPPQPIED